MATPIQRLQAVVNALIDGTATSDQLVKVGEAYVFKASDDEVMQVFGIPKAQLNNTQKAQVALEVLRRDVKAAVRYKAEQDACTLIAYQVEQAGTAAEQGF